MGGCRPSVPACPCRTVQAMNSAQSLCFAAFPGRCCLHIASYQAQRPTSPAHDGPAAAAASQLTTKTDPQMVNALVVSFIPRSAERSQKALFTLFRRHFAEKPRELPREYWPAAQRKNLKSVFFQVFLRYPTTVNWRTLGIAGFARFTLKFVQKRLSGKWLKLLEPVCCAPRGGYPADVDIMGNARMSTLLSLFRSPSTSFRMAGQWVSQPAARLYLC